MFELQPNHFAGLFKLFMHQFNHASYFLHIDFRRTDLSTGRFLLSRHLTWLELVQL